MSSQVPFVGNFHFLVEIDGLTGDSSVVVGGFSEVRGLGSETEVLEFFVGNSPAPVQVPGKTRYSNITLRRGVTSSNDLYDWRREVERGLPARRSGAIILLDHDMTEKTRWNFYDAWPCRYEAPELESNGSAISVETLELCVGRIERASP
jgi:phage tail-like protein